MVILAACAGGGEECAVLDRAQRMINDSPDSALAILDSLEPSSQDFSRSTLRRWQLLRLMAQNKCDTVFRSDSLQQELTGYFDRHGTPNERMMAHYLLGRAYSDMGEVPLALRAYQDAVSHADTISTDCDWWNLCRVMLQISYLFYYQNMPHEELEILDKAFTVAMKAGDTVTAIMCREKKAEVYDLLGQEDSVALTGLVASMMYDEIGRRDLAAQTLSLVIPYQITLGNYKEAKRNMHRYETESGFFDSNGNIVNGREYYYCLKGRYHLGAGENDSAFYYFDKVLRGCDNFDNLHAASRGMMELFRQTGIPDSTLKYAMMSERYKDSVYTHTYTEELQRMKRMYDFTNQLEKTHHQEVAISRQSRTIYYLFLLSAALCCVLALFSKSARKITSRFKREKEMNAKCMDELQQQMNTLLSEKKKALADLERQEKMVGTLMEAYVLLQEAAGIADSGGKHSEKMQEALSVFDAIIKENEELEKTLSEKARLLNHIVKSKNSEIDQLTDKINAIGKKRRTNNLDSSLIRTEIYQMFRKISDKPISTPTNKQWDELENIMKDSLPDFWHLLEDHADLSIKEKRLCLLVRAGFKPTDISNLMGIDRSNVSMMRTRLYSKLFGGNGNGRDLDQLLKTFS